MSLTVRSKVITTKVHATSRVRAEPIESKAVRSGEWACCKPAKASCKGSGQARWCCQRAAKRRRPRVTASSTHSTTAVATTNAKPKRGSGKTSTSSTKVAVATSAVAQRLLREARRLRPSTPRNSAAGETDTARPTAGKAKVKAVSTPKPQATTAGAIKPDKAKATGNLSATNCAPPKAKSTPSTTPAVLAKTANKPICNNTNATKRPSRKPKARKVARLVSLPCR